MVGGSGELGQASERGSPDTIEGSGCIFMGSTGRITVYFTYDFV